MRILNLFTCVIALTLFVSCSDSGKQKSSNEESTASLKNEVVNSEITACQHASKIYWKGSKPTGDHSGIIKLKSGNYFVENNELIGGEFILEMNSILNIDIENEDKNAKLVKHLKSDDFFNVDSFPEGKFVITAVEEIDHESFTHQIVGDLTLKAITNSISFKATVKVNDGVVNATSEEFSINRTLWGINYKSKSVFGELKDKFIHDDFFIKIEAYSM